MWDNQSYKSHCRAMFLLMWSSQWMLHWHRQHPWHLSPFCSFARHTCAPSHSAQRKAQKEHWAHDPALIFYYSLNMFGHSDDLGAQMLAETKDQSWALSCREACSVGNSFYLFCILLVIDFQLCNQWKNVCSHIRGKRKHKCCTKALRLRQVTIWN